MADELIERSATLERVISEAKLDAVPLPPLVRQPGAFEKWFEEMLHKFNQLMENWFRSSSTTIKWDFWIQFIKYAFYCIVVMAIAGLIVWIILQLTRAMKVPDGKTTDITSAELPEDQLEILFRAALRTQNFSLAARLRWILFLSRLQLDRGLTPREFSEMKSVRFSWINELYRIMFSGSQSEEFSFQRLELQLAEAEKQFL